MYKNKHTDKGRIQKQKKIEWTKTNKQKGRKKEKREKEKKLTLNRTDKRLDINTQNI